MQKHFSPTNHARAGFWFVASGRVEVGFYTQAKERFGADSWALSQRYAGQIA